MSSQPNLPHLQPPLCHTVVLGAAVVPVAAVVEVAAWKQWLSSLILVRAVAACPDEGDNGGGRGGIMGTGSQ